MSGPEYIDPDATPEFAYSRFDHRHPRRWDVAVVIAIGGAVGSIARWGLNEAIPHDHGGFPWATFVENVSGCLVIGVLMVFLLDVWAPHRYARPFLAIGILGGYTTFSTYTVDTRGLLDAGDGLTALAYFFGTLLVGLLATWLGLTIGRALAGQPRPRRARAGGGMTALLVLLGGALGAPGRWYVDGYVRTKHATTFPWGTVLINACGSLLLGFVVGSASAGGASHTVVVLIGTGFCGAFTTFSTFGFETVRLAEEGEYRSAAGNVVASLGVGLAMAALGWSIGHALWA